MSDKNDKSVVVSVDWEQQRLELTSRYSFKTLNARNPGVATRTLANGDIVLSAPAPQQCERTIVAYLRSHAANHPARTVLAERDASGCWRRVSYAEMKNWADAIGQGFIDFGLTAGGAVLVLSDNSIEHAAIALGAMTVGVTVVPVSPAYSLQDMTYKKLHHVVDVVKPALIFVQDAQRYAPVLRELAKTRAKVIAVDNAGDELGVWRFADMLHRSPTHAVEQAYERTGPDTIAKVLFTSGSTGSPKGVINTQRMLCTNMAMQDAMWQAEENEFPYVTISWMPWNHTMAGNGLFHRSLRQGGTYYIDHGKPLPGAYAPMVASLREISPHSHSDVPAGFSMLADALEADADLNNRFFANLRFLQYAGASLPESLWVRLQRLSVAATGKLTPFITGYGCTEAGPLITQLYWTISGSGVIGLPAPGIEVKLTAVDDQRYELRARGPNITPGYLNDAARTAAAFDSEGFYRTEDSVTFVDANAPEKGLRFASRVSEDFKLQTGTFVAAGPVRANALRYLSPLIRDVVLAGENRAYLALLAWPNIAECRVVAGPACSDLSDVEIIAHPRVLATIRAALEQHNQQHASTSQRIARLLLLHEPPSSAENEITEKGYVNQRRVLERRASDVMALYGDQPLENLVLAEALQETNNR